MIAGHTEDKPARDLFGKVSEPMPPVERPARKPRRLRHGWTITAHVCRVCFGRILQHGEQVMCACCEIKGATARDICACGMKFNTGRDVGIRCIPNPAVSISHPSVIVAGEPDV